jgi:hypothetical protein
MIASAATIVTVAVAVAARRRRTEDDKEESRFEQEALSPSKEVSIEYVASWPRNGNSLFA